MRDQKISFFFFFEGGPEDKLCSVFLLLGVNKLLKLTIDLHKKKGGGDYYQLVAYPLTVTYLSKIAKDKYVHTENLVHCRLSCG